MSFKSSKVSGSSAASAFDGSSFQAVASELRSSNGLTFSVVTYNILHHQSLLSWKDGYYRMCPPVVFEKDFRIGKLREQLKEKLQADILCLQEAEKSTFKEDFGDFLESLGYQYVVQNPKKEKDGHDSGNVIAFKKDLFKLQYEDPRSRSLIAGLQFVAGSSEEESKESDEGRTFIILCNCHLEGHPDLEDKRFDQLNSSMKQMQKMQRRIQQDFRADKVAPQFGYMFLGDFNSTPERILFKLMLLGKLPGKTFDTSKTDLEVIKSDVTLPFQMKCTTVDSLLSDEKMAKDFEHCRDLLCDKFQSTFIVKTMMLGCVDYIWYTDESIINHGSLRVVDDETERSKLFEAGLPSEMFASDHIPVGAVLSFRKRGS